MEEDGADTLTSLHQPLPVKKGFQILGYLNSDASLHHMTLHVTCSRVMFAAAHVGSYTADLSCFSTHIPLFRSFSLVKMTKLFDYHALILRRSAALLCHPPLWRLQS